MKIIAIAFIFVSSLAIPIWAANYGCSLLDHWPSPFNFSSDSDKKDLEETIKKMADCIQDHETRIIELEFQLKSFISQIERSNNTAPSREYK